METIREALTLVCMLLNLVPPDCSLQITMVYIKLDGFNQLQIVYDGTELKQASLCLVNKSFLNNKYICCFDKKIRNKNVYAIYIKTFCYLCAFYVTHHLP